MLHKTHNSLVTLAAVMLALVGVSQPAKAFLLAQADVTPTTFNLPDELPAEATVKIATSNSTSSINQSLKESFIEKYPQAQVNIETQSSEAALQSLSEGQVDLVGIGRNLTATERQKGLIAVPISREKIAIVISKDNPFNGNLTISQFAQIFRGEITDWSEIGGNPGTINLVDLPDTNDTRQAFPSYPVFQESEFITGANTTQLEEDSLDNAISKLGTNGIGYAVANDVIDRDDIKIVTMHQTQPDDERYPFSQPFYLVYQGEPTEPTEAFLGFATSQGGEEVITNRIGSLSTASAIAIASKLANPSTDNSNLPETSVDGNANLADAGEDSTVDTNATADVEDDTVDTDATTDVEDDTVGTDATADAGDGTVDTDATADAGDGTVDTDATADAGDGTVDTDATADASDGTAETDATADAGDDTVDTANADLGDQVQPDTEGSGQVDPNLDGSGEINPELEGSGQVDPNLDGSGQVDPNLDGSGEINPDLEESGQVDPNLQDSGEPNAVNELEGNDQIASNSTTNGEAVISGDTDGAEATAAPTRKGQWWWWLPLILGIPTLAAVALSGWGAKKRGDNEPALGDLPDPNAPNGGGATQIPDGGELSAVGASGANNVGTVAKNGANTSTQLEATAIAGGAAAIGGATAAGNFVSDQTTTEEDTDVDLDRIELDNITDLPAADLDEITLDEIPSDSVTEFSGQETKLQVTDQSTKLQTDVAEDITDNTSDLLDGISNAGGAAIAGGAAAIGGAAAASGLFGDREATNNEDLEDTTEEETPSYSSTELVSEQTTKLQLTDQSTDLQTELNEVVDGTITNINQTEDNLSQEFDGDFVLDEETSSNIEDINLEGSVSETLSNSINNLETPQLDTEVEDINLEGNVSETVSDSINNLETPQLDTEVENTENDNSSWLDGISNAGGAAIAGGAAAIGGAAAASGLFSDRSEISEAELEITSETATDINLDEITFDDVDTSVDASLDEITLDSSETATDINLDEITFDDVDTSVDASLDEITFDDVDTSVDASLDEITLDDVEEQSIDELIDSVKENIKEEPNISLDDLGFNRLNNSTSDLLSDNAAEITDLDNSQSSDMNNISAWLDNLKTPENNSEDIGEWLDGLNVEDSNSQDENNNKDNDVDSKYEVEDISFQFLEDLLERDSD